MAPVRGVLDPLRLRHLAARLRAVPRLAAGAARPSLGVQAAERRGMTLKTRLIPCLDVKDGRVVKGVQFVDLRDAGDPVEAAIAYDAAGADELCFLDITASAENRDTIFDVVARTAEQCFMPVTVGGGIRTVEDIRKLLLSGADKVSINTAAVNDPDFVARAADKYRRPVHRRLGRRAPPADRAPSAAPTARTGRSSPMAAATPTGLDAVEFAARMVERGAGELLVTSMDRDGTKQGFDLELTRAIADAVQRAGRRLGRRRLARRSGRRGRRRATPTRCSPPRSSTSAPLRSPRPRPICASTASRCGWTEARGD